MQVHLQTKLMGAGRLCARDFPKAEWQTPAHCWSRLPSAVLLFIFPLPGGKKMRGKKIVYFKGYRSSSFKREHWKKGGKKRILCKSSGGFQNFPFLPGIDMIFPFALSSPLWHSWYISLSIITNFKAPPPCHFCKPSRLKYKCWFQLPYFLEFGAGCGLRNAEELPGTFINF